MHEMLELAEGVTVPAPEDGSEIRFSQEAVDHVENFLSLLVFGQNEWAGTPFKILPWEYEAIRNFYGVKVYDPDMLKGIWVRYRRFLYVEIPKKNGKSEFAAALGLYHLIADGEKTPNIGIFAADKDNARIIYNAAKYMVEHTALGQGADPLVWCRDSVKEIRTKFGGVMKIYSSDAENKHGYSFSVVIIDELHAQKNRNLWDVLTVGTDAARRQQAVIVLTTAGNDPDMKSIGWEVHEKCRRILAWRRGEPEREMDTDDVQWCPIMYGISTMTGDDPDRIAELDIYDPDLWKKCNPSYGVTLKPRQFRTAAAEAKQSEAAERNFRWLRLNQWVATKAVGWIPLTIWDKTQIGPSPLRERLEWRASLLGKRCYAGLDLSKTTDLTALVLLFPPQDGLDTWVAIYYGIWRPEDGVLDAEQRDHVPYRDWERAGFLSLCKGSTINYDDVYSRIMDAAEAYQIEALGFDPALSWQLIPRIMEGCDARHIAPVNCIEIPQTMRGESEAIKAIEKDMRDHQLLHEHNTCARWTFGNVRLAEDGNENCKLMKNRSIGRIDPQMALVNAKAAAILVENAPADLADTIARGQFSM